MVRESQKRATTKYENKVYEKLCIRIREDRDGLTRDELTRIAAAAGQSVNEYVLQAIRERIERGSDPPEIIPEITREPFFDN